MKTYKERTEAILRKKTKKERTRKIIKRSVLGAAAFSALTALNLTLFLPYKVETPSVAAYKDSEYYAVICSINDLRVKSRQPKYKNNFEKWRDGLSDLFSFGCGAKGGDMVAEPSVDYESSVSSEGYVETTDNQVAGVVEGDLFKRTDSHVFYLDTAAQVVRIYPIAGLETAQVGEISLVTEEVYLYSGEEQALYLSADGTRLTVVQSAMTKDTKERLTVLTGYDVSNPLSPTAVGKSYFTGQYITSRAVGGELLVINRFRIAGGFAFENERSYLPHYGALNDMQPVAGEDIVCPENASSWEYAVLCAVDMQTLSVQDCTALFSYDTKAYVSTENVYLSRQYNEKAEGLSRTMTELSCIYYGGEGLEYEGSVTVQGEVKNQYSMDEYNGLLRVATTNEENQSLISGVLYNYTAASLYCIDFEKKEIVGSVEKFIENERVESVRFDKEKAYVCTAVRVTLTDPVFAFDLTDVKNITYVDTGVIEGYSTSLVNFKDGYLLGIGYGDDWGVKIEIYAEGAEKVESVCSVEKEGYFSEEYKSYYINRERGEIGLCISDGNGGTYYVFAFDGYQLTAIVEQSVDFVSSASNSAYRATAIDGYLYIFCYYECYVVALP